MLLKTKILSCCAILLLLCTNARGNDKSVTYTVDARTAVTAQGDIPEGTTATYYQACTVKYRVLKNTSTTLTLTGFDNLTITGITLLMKSNTKSGAGSLSVTCGNSTLASIADATFADASWNGKYTTTYTNITPEVTPYKVGVGESINIVVRASVNSLYCKSFTITYSEGSPSVSAPVISLASGDYIGEQHVRLSLPEDNTASKILYTTDGTDPRNGSNNPTAITEDADIVVTSPTTIKAVATNDAGEYSAVVKRTYNVFVPTKTTRAALAGQYSSISYAMSATDLKAVAVNAVNGKIINADDDLKDMLNWNIYETDDSAVIMNDTGEFLTGGSTQTLTLGTKIFKWAKAEENDSWENSNRTFLYSASGDGTFSNLTISNIGKDGYQADWTRAHSFSDGYVRQELTSGQLASVCLPCDVAEQDFMGAELFEIAGVVKSTPDMTVNDVTGIAIKPVTELSAGTPYILQATGDLFIAAYSGEPVEEAATATGLVGNLSGAKIAVGASDATHWNYVIYKNKLRKIVSAGSATIASNRAYIDLYGVPEYTGNDESVKTISLSDGSTGINSTSVTPTSTATYNLNGVRMPARQTRKGIYIRNGRKQIVPDTTPGT